MKMHFRHILVKHAYEAEDILRLLKQGRDFAELAKSFSTCASAPQGGDLGEHDSSRHRLDEDFAEAAFALKPGETTTKPIRTRFGYHVIQAVPGS